MLRQFLDCLCRPGIHCLYLRPRNLRYENYIMREYEVIAPLRSKVTSFIPACTDNFAYCIYSICRLCSWTNIFCRLCLSRSTTYYEYLYDRPRNSSRRRRRKRGMVCHKITTAEGERSKGREAERAREVPQGMVGTTDRRSGGREGQRSCEAC